ncbi:MULTISPECIES: glycosyltransferase family 4 protein [Bradyrhizobium]|jgi:glycosyltransferase involved in cell wall biosynthesis|uniref:glycosyltransferase family 4 protein n=1 Tax=Bradyrhizobium TaxID=374 RepID=UPI00202354EE|nr:glycosyltransferase family 4 protein [Bradyrhizobium denitrificans]MCL8485459.1 glycosyltransferase family 4 protein [Bradyrhizobium denitrificans]
MSSTTVVCCAEMTDPNWTWIAPHFPGTGLKFVFAICRRRRIDSYIRAVNLGRVLGALDGVMKAKRVKADVLVTHGPALAAWCALFAWLLRSRSVILAHSFNFASVPRGLKRIVFRILLARVDGFVVFSNVEREIYSEAFNIPIERFDFVHWGMATPATTPSIIPAEDFGYVAAIGGNARDYKTLVEAATILPDIKFVLVVRPENLDGLKLPGNVFARVDIGFGEAMEILRLARFMVLPLNPGEVPCGHITLVAAMHLGKAIIATSSPGVSDYVQNEENSISVKAGAVDELADAIRRLWGDNASCDRLGERGRLFAAANCTEAGVAKQFRAFLARRGLFEE